VRWGLNRDILVITIINHHQKHNLRLILCV